jgi:hypothetical protein
MSAMPLDTALNLVWLSIGAFALASLAVLERRLHRNSTSRARLLRLCAVLIVTVALFPAVSSTDDLFSFSLLNSQLGNHGGAGSSLPENPSSRPDKASLQLVRLLETLEHYQVAAIYTLAFTLSCFAVVFAFVRDAIARPILCRSGRAPPLA